MNSVLSIFFNEKLTRKNRNESKQLFLIAELVALVCVGFQYLLKMRRKNISMSL